MKIDLVLMQYIHSLLCDSIYRNDKRMSKKAIKLYRRFQKLYPNANDYIIDMDGLDVCSFVPTYEYVESLLKSAERA